MILGHSIGLNRPKTFVSNVSPVTGALYNYTTTSAQNPPKGSMYVGNGGLNLFFNEVDANAVNHGGDMQLIHVGDKINVSTNTATIVTAPRLMGPGTWLISVDAWPVLANGQYTVTITKQGATYDPSHLFINGEEGAWYDPSDLSTMFQDSAGTTPVTGVGQPVGLILDKSGNDNHASQATAAKRPLLQNDGVNNYLAFDGVDDALATASIDFTGTDKISMFSGVTKTVDTGFGCICELDAAVIDPGLWATGTGYSLRVSSFGYVSNAAYPAPHTDVLTGLFSTGEIPDGRINAVADAFQTGPSILVGFFEASVCQIGDRTSGGVPLNGRIYSLIVLGRLATPEEIDQTEAWVAERTGVTLP